MNDIRYVLLMLFVYALFACLVFGVLIFIGSRKNKKFIAKTYVSKKQYTMFVSRVEIGGNLAGSILFFLTPSIPYHFGVTGYVAFLVCVILFWPFGIGLLIYVIARSKWKIEVENTSLRIRLIFERKEQIASLDDVTKVEEVYGAAGYYRVSDYNVFFNNKNVLQLDHSVMGRDIFLKEMEARGKVIRCKRQ